MKQEALRRLAARQHSLFIRAQALAIGLSAKQIEGGARAGLWIRVYRGVYRIAGAPVTHEQRILAAVLACGQGAMASHRAAGWVWRLGDEQDVDVSGPVNRKPAPDVIIFHRLELPRRPVTHRGIPCADPLRTIVDLAALGDRTRVERALDRGVATGLVTVRAVEAELERRAGKGVAGCALLRSCLAARLDGAGGRTSDLESLMDRLIVRFGLPAPIRQFWVPGTRYRLDYAWPEWLTTFEVDGYEPHAGLEAFRADRVRQNLLVLLGWTVLRFTWDDLRTRPAGVADQFWQAIKAKALPPLPA